METFTLRNEEGVTFVDWEGSAYRIKVEKDRKVTIADKAAFIEATLYKEDTTFVPECIYIFEALPKTKNDNKVVMDIELFHSAVSFFFHSVLSTTYFVVSIPFHSSIYKAPAVTMDNIGFVDTTNLYNILSGY
jgi:hypothetical protein